ncbi:uncharacterized protein LAESUDRAFT_716531 [Laetiporus sulphureus 93-53]|uniref:Uncharacterized protein n=1 Tax=Laetiporus sulphureus 93-53 TaxID=1314785 RepID=A0A165CK09_9APHY|nr:uncharacterized protein LAESUDRAFT_716531 [Laetiporus sulphureus 93-53]KZT02950.1 hypothetical protein LAESUDRAFT_716531 [Laetiporus sulphureus 93-53]
MVLVPLAHEVSLGLDPFRTSAPVEGIGGCLLIAPYETTCAPSPSRASSVPGRSSTVDAAATQVNEGLVIELAVREEQGARVLLRRKSDSGEIDGPSDVEFYVENAHLNENRLLAKLEELFSTTLGPTVTANSGSLRLPSSEIRALLTSVTEHSSGSLHAETIATHVLQLLLVRWQSEEDSLKGLVDLPADTNGEDLAIGGKCGEDGASSITHSNYERVIQKRLENMDAAISDLDCAVYDITQSMNEHEEEVDGRHHAVRRHLNGFERNLARQQADIDSMSNASEVLGERVGAKEECNDDPSDESAMERLDHLIRQARLQLGDCTGCLYPSSVPSSSSRLLKDQATVINMAQLTDLIEQYVTIGRNLELLAGNFIDRAVGTREFDATSTLLLTNISPGDQEGEESARIVQHSPVVHPVTSHEAAQADASRARGDWDAHADKRDHEVIHDSIRNEGIVKDSLAVYRLVSKKCYQVIFMALNIQGPKNCYVNIARSRGIAGSTWVLGHRTYRECCAPISPMHSYPTSVWGIGVVRPLLRGSAGRDVGRVQVGRGEAF